MGVIRWLSPHVLDMILSRCPPESSVIVPKSPIPREYDFWDIAQADEQPEEPGRVEYKFLGVTGEEQS